MEAYNIPLLLRDIPLEIIENLKIFGKCVYCLGCGCFKGGE